MSETTWIRNLQNSLLLNPLVAMHGNVRDLYAIPDQLRHCLPAEMSETRYVDFPIWLALDFERRGYDIVVIYDSVDEAVFLHQQMADRFSTIAGNSGGSDRRAPAPAALSPGPPLPGARQQSPVGDNSKPSDWMVKLPVGMPPENFVATLTQRFLSSGDCSIAVVFRYTDRYLSFTDRQDAQERRLSILLQKAAAAVPQNHKQDRPASRIVMLFDLEGAVPRELGAQAPFAGAARIPMPSPEDRESFFRFNHEQFFIDQANPFRPDQNAAQLADITSLCDGLSTRDMLGLAKLSRQEELGLNEEQFKSLIDHFRFGKRENAWQKIRTETLVHAAERLRQRVQGQDQVIQEVIPTLIRAKLDLVDITKQIHSPKPRGVFFFVGPTGVGKTELSKAIAELIFGDENQMTRFDMSEYSEEYQQARLIGAPPGYVGFDQGGQLPNAILEQPFSVLLFDEIEKAHPGILDKFLQILDDGRLTDGSGRTVYFSETIIVFTSNIGTGGHQNAELGNLEYAELREHFQTEVRNFFVNKLGRPEILNRIGEDNILVFNYLRDETARNKIIERQIQDLAEIIRKRFRFGIQLTEQFRSVLKFHPRGFQSNGARGVRNLLRKLVLDGLALQIFKDSDSFANRTFVVDYDSVGTVAEGFEFPATEFFMNGTEQWNWIPRFSSSILRHRSLNLPNYRSPTFRTILMWLVQGGAV